MIELVAGAFALFVVCYQYNQTIRRMKMLIEQLEHDKATLVRKLCDKQKHSGSDTSSIQSRLQHDASSRTD